MRLFVHVGQVITFLIRVRRFVVAMALGLGWLALVLVGAILGRMANQIRDSERYYRR